MMRHEPATTPKVRALKEPIDADDSGVSRLVVDGCSSADVEMRYSLRVVLGRGLEVTIDGVVVLLDEELTLSVVRAAELAIEGFRVVV